MAAEWREIEPWEPEESVGKLWHAFASRLDAPADYPDARVALADVSGRIQVLFRGLGGNPSVELRAAANRVSSLSDIATQSVETAAQIQPFASEADRDADYASALSLISRMRWMRFLTPPSPNTCSGPVGAMSVNGAS